LPPFISIDMRMSSLVNGGLLEAECDPMVLYSDSPPPFVLPNEERAIFERRKDLLKRLKPKSLSHRGELFSDLDQYYQSAYPLLRDPKASPVFKIDPEDKKRYGNSKIGDACIMARNIVDADAGAKFIFVGCDGWDIHADIYSSNAKDKSGGQYMPCAHLDGGLSGLLDDLEARTDKGGRRLIDKTLIVVMGEFGRTPGEPTIRKGRDHYRYAAVGVFAGAGVQGGKVLGATNDEGGRVIDSGWHRSRSIYPEDVLVTIYSALGIDWTKKITQTPSGRSFEYIEYISPKGLMEFSEIKELFA